MKTLRPVLLAAVLAAGGCSPPPPAAPAARAQRIVSLDYCADQFVLALVERERILALSPDARAPFSYMRAAASGMPTVRPRAEDVLVLAPDLVVRSYGGGVGAPALLRRAGVPLLQIGFADTLDRVRANLRDAAKALDATPRAEAIVAQMDARLARLARARRDTTVLYMTPSGVTAGPGTLVHEMLDAAGVVNFVQQPGWRPVPLERLAYRRPDVVAIASFGAGASYDRTWTPAHHPVARRTMARAHTVRIDGATTSCGGWFLADAVAAVAAAAPR